MKLQIIIALVAGLIIFAVPLYLWRRPKPEPIPSADAAVVDAGAPLVSPVVAFDAGPPGNLALTPFTTIKCEKPGPGKTPPERCDHVTTFEDALARAIRERPDCAPASKTAYTVSYVMETDFRKKKLTLFTGKSSSVKREKAKELLRCVKAAMPTTDWASISHQYTRYKVRVDATYPPRDAF
ncbi:Hypothetical protein A7982_10882 [Minicystis rosea]|nr:Hypothetical protein A7982_10882 [Minicystis rosea]